MMEADPLPAFEPAAFDPIPADPGAVAPLPPPPAEPPPAPPADWLRTEAARFQAHVTATLAQLDDRRRGLAAFESRLESAQVQSAQDLSRRRQELEERQAAADARDADLAARERAVRSAEADKDAVLKSIDDLRARNREMATQLARLTARRDQLAAAVATAEACPLPHEMVRRLAALESAERVLERRAAELDDMEDRLRAEWVAGMQALGVGR